MLNWAIESGGAPTGVPMQLQMHGRASAIVSRLFRCCGSLCGATLDANYAHKQLQRATFRCFRGCSCCAANEKEIIQQRDTLWMQAGGPAMGWLDHSGCRSSIDRPALGSPVLSCRGDEEGGLRRRWLHVCRARV